MSVVESLIKVGVNVNVVVVMFILLVIVCFNCYIELVKVLIDVEVDVNF